MTNYVFDLMIESAARAAVLAAAAAAALGVFRVRDAALRSAVWTVVLGAALLMPVAVTVNPRIQLLPAPAAALAAQADDAASSGTVLAYPPDTGEAGAPNGAAPPIDWRVAAGWLYAAVACALLARILGGLWWGVRLRRHSGRLAELGAGVYESPNVRTPLTFGVFRPAVVLPDDWRQWDRRKLRAVLLHEFAHVERGDFLIQLSAALHAALFWFSPMAWWMQKHLAALAEHASDDRVLRDMGDAPYYAEVVFSFLGNPALGMAVVPMARGSRAGARIDRILNGGRPLTEGVVRARTMAGIAALAVPLLFLVSSITFAQTPAPPPPPAPAAPVAAPVAPAPPSPVHVAQVKPAPVPPSPPPPPVGNRMNGIQMQSHNGNYLRITESSIRFGRGNKDFAIDDAALVSQANELFRPVREFGEKQRELGQQQRELGQQQRELGEKMRGVSTAMPDLTRQIEEIRKRSEELRAKGTVTQDEIGRLQGLIGRLQSQVGRTQSAAGSGQSAVGEEMSALGQKQSALGERQSELGMKQAEASRRAQEQLEKLLDQAIRDGRARELN